MILNVSFCPTTQRGQTFLSVMAGFAMPDAFPLVAVDIGNSRIKAGLFDGGASTSLPVPRAVVELSPPQDPMDRLRELVDPRPTTEVAWWVASVNRRWTEHLRQWLRGQGRDAALRLLGHSDLPLRVNLPRPEQAGIDRLLGAVAANRLRGSRPAIVVDLGTAITIDLITADGAFQGGAILPGIGMSSRAFHTFTDLLPDVAISTLDQPPPVLGKDTIAAMQSGLYWGAVGGIREVVRRLEADLAEPPLVLLTGGAAPSVAAHVAADAQYVPHLVLGGLALAVAHAAP